MFCCDLLENALERGAFYFGAHMSRPDAAHAIAQVGAALLEKSTYIDLLAAPPSRSGESTYLM